MDKIQKAIELFNRVSSSENKNNLDTQTKRLEQYAIGVNDNRKKLQKILKDGKATCIIVEHKDRLTRFGFNYLEKLVRYKEVKSSGTGGWRTYSLAD